MAFLLKKFTKIRKILLIGFFIIFSLSPSTLINESKPCQLCDFFVMIDRIFKFFLVPDQEINNMMPLVPIIAILMIMIGGFLYVIAYGAPDKGPEMINKAKSVFSAVVFGLLIAYGAWLIVDLFFLVIGVADGPWTKGADGKIEWFKINCGA